VLKREAVQEASATYYSMYFKFMWEKEGMTELVNGRL